MNLVIEELLNNGFSLMIERRPNSLQNEYILDGFYKSGTITLIENEDKLIAKARYDELTEINSFEDLVNLNYKWWQYSKDRFDGWKNPESKWMPFLIKANLIVETIKTESYYE